MNRAFVTLYLFIVASVVAIGWGLNQLWETVAPEQQPSAEIQALFELIEHRVLLQPAARSSDAAQQLSEQLDLPVELLALDDLAQSAAMEDLRAGNIIAARSSDNIIWYKRLAQTEQVVMLSIPLADHSESPFYRLLLLVFYCAIALTIYVWVWPLSRDSKKLERQTRTLGKDGVPDTLNISPTSTLYPLARAFNQMATRVRELIASHREMTNAVSHELRTPLARMKFALAMIDEQLLDAKSRAQLRSLEQDVSEMEALINSLLMYAGFEQKSQSLQQSRGQMGPLLEELARRFSSETERDLHLEIRIAPGAGEVCCEWKLMETVLHNLIGNARKYAATNICIELTQTDTDHVLALEDDGPGIPADERVRVFESFVRLYSEQADSGASVNSSTGGFGLGLAIVKRIMQWHAGSAAFVEPKLLGGARAEIRWPKTPSQKPC